MQCNCSWYINERFVCPHMVVILEQIVLPDLQDENKDITDIIAMTSIFKKKQATEIIDHASQFTQFSQEPIVIQSTRPREVPDNQRYHKLHESFELPDINMAFNAVDLEESIPSTSAAVANAPPFNISSCLRPVGRAKVVLICC